MKEPFFSFMPVTNPWSGPEPQQSEKDWCMFLHLSSLSGFIIPFGTLIGPLIMWMVKKDESAYIDAHGRRAVDFYISLMIVAVIGIILSFVCIGIPILIGVLVVYIIGLIQAVMAAKAANLYRYPCSFSFLASSASPIVTDNTQPAHPINHDDPQNPA